jgi:hypothetical protein
MLGGTHGLIDAAILQHLLHGDKPRRISQKHPSAALSDVALPAHVPEKWEPVFR